MLNDDGHIELLQKYAEVMEERNEYLRIFNDMAEDFLDRKWTWVFISRFFNRYWRRFYDTQKRYAK